MLEKLVPEWKSGYFCQNVVQEQSKSKENAFFGNQQNK